MWLRVIAKLIAVFGLYIIVLARMANQGQGAAGYSPGMLELAAVTVLFVIVAVFVLAWRPRRRAKTTLDELDE
jgi:drug/metabolite transporter (DMT)-like permease